MGVFAAYLKETDLFNNLNREQLTLIEGICEDRVYAAGEIIFEENARENELYLIIQGQVDILVNPMLVSDTESSEAAPIVIGKFWPGQSFGEMALVDEGIRSGSAVATADRTHLLRIPRRELIALCEKYPDMGYRIMYNLALDLSQKIRNTGLKMREVFLQSRQDRENEPGQ
jgi:CRP/FNR family transcriptional regulator, cyclic AMP receptor protein